MNAVGSSMSSPLQALRTQARGLDTPATSQAYNDLVSLALVSESFQGSNLLQNVKDLGFHAASAAQRLSPALRQDMLHRALEGMNAGVPGSVGVALAKIARDALAAAQDRGQPATASDKNHLATSVLFAVRSQHEPGVADTADLALRALKREGEAPDNGPITSNALQTIAALDEQPVPSDPIRLLRTQAEGLDRPETRSAFNRLVAFSLTGPAFQDSPTMPPKSQALAMEAALLSDGLPPEAGGSLLRQTLATLELGEPASVGMTLIRLASNTLAEGRRGEQQLTQDQEFGLSFLALANAYRQHEPGVSDSASFALQCLRREENSLEATQITCNAVETIAAQADDAVPKSLISRLRRQADGLDRPETRAAYVRFVLANLSGPLTEGSDVSQKVKDFGLAAAILSNGDPNLLRLSLERLDSGLPSTTGASLAQLAQAALEQKEAAGVPAGERQALAQSALRLIRKYSEPWASEQAKTALSCLNQLGDSPTAPLIAANALNSIAAWAG